MQFINVEKNKNVSYMIKSYRYTYVYFMLKIYIFFISFFSLKIV